MPFQIDPALPVIMVEGEMDALACAACGIKNLFAAGGTNGLTGPKVKKYLLGVPEIILCFDAEEKGRKASGLDPLEPGDGRKSNVPQIIKRAGYEGKIRVAELPPEAETGCKDQDALVLAGKRDVIEKAIKEAKEYTPPPETEKEVTKKTGTIWEAYDSISVERLRDLLKKIPKEVLDTEDIQPFISACVKACKHSATKQELAKWGAIPEDVNAKNDTSPYFLIEACEKYGVSKYLKREIEKSLVPESEILKIIKNDNINIKIDFEKVKNFQSVKQFIATGGVHSAARVVCDVLNGNVVFIKEEGEFYFFDGHVWNYESNMEGIVYNILCSILSYYLKNKLKEKGYLWDMIIKVDGWRFRVETVQDFSGFHGIHITDASFDGPGIKETLTLSNGVMDFSGSEIIYRKSIREEFRRYCLPYSIEDVKGSGAHTKFDAFMKQNFKNEKTLETLIYYLSLIPSRNTQFKYGGIFIGKRHTGKTTTIEVIRKIYPTMLGNIPPDILVTRGRRNNSGNEATPYIAALEGKGAGVASETEKGAVLNNALFKLLTGGDTLIARGLYKAPRSFTPTAQIIIATNHSPRFDAQDSATVDRMVIIPFSVTHERGGEGTKSQDAIINSLRSEFPAVVKMLAEYYIKLRSEFDGAIPFSDECLNYKNNYVDEQRTDLDKFVSDNIEFGLSGEHFEKVEDLYNRFLLYYDISEEDAEKEALPRKKFTYLLRRDFLEMKNYKKKKFGDKALPCFFNIKLKPWDENSERPAPQGFFDTETVSESKGKKVGTKAQTQTEPPEEENPFD
jgi:phage/plasmid-associated DNA primase